MFRLTDAQLNSREAAGAAATHRWAANFGKTPTSVTFKTPKSPFKVLKVAGWRAFREYAPPGGTDGRSLSGPRINPVGNLRSAARISMLPGLLGAALSAKLRRLSKPYKTA
jgi:hypothetical protein